MAHSMDFLASGAALFGRLVAALLRRAPAKRLEVTIVGRGIVAELPFDAPCRLVDLNGAELRGGVYVLVVRIWNRGTLPVLLSDFAPSAPLQLKLPTSVRLLDVDTMSTVESFKCEAILGDNQTITVEHEGFNPGDDAIVNLYFTGQEQQIDLAVSGRIVGQTTPLDRTDLEHRAGIGERFTAAFLLAILVSAAPALLCSAWLISTTYGWIELWRPLNRIPQWVEGMFAWGVTPVCLLAITALGRWLKRRSQPIGFPIESDLEPSGWTSTLYMLKMVVTGRRYRVSSSLFSIGEPLLMPSKRIRQRSVHDWLQ